MGTIGLLLYKYFISTINLIKIYFTNIFYFFLGLFITTPIIGIYTVITLPFILCHSLIAQILSKFYRGDYGYRKMVSPGFSTAYALEYISSVWKGEPSKNTILSRTLIEGHMPLEFCKAQIKTGWINAKTDKNIRKFPMFRQYVHSWMGYCYWRKDFNFDLDTHLHFHKINEFQDLDQSTSNLFEELMNTPFKQNRSPWDVYIIHGWRQTSTSENNSLIDNTEVTVLITRIHHALGDGKSMASLLIKDLFGNHLKDCRRQPATPSNLKSSNNSPNKVWSLFTTVLKLMLDFGCITYFVIWKAKANTRLHKSDSAHHVHQMSPLISMDSIKSVRKKFGVKLSSVLVSSMVAAIADYLDDDNVGEFLLAAPRPLPGHPEDRMVNHLTGVAYNVPLGVEKHPIQRLLECDQVLKMVNKSLFPTHIFPVLFHMLSFHIAPIAKFGFKSRHFGASFSNNVGSEVTISAFGKYKILEMNGAVGTFDGSTGVVILMISYGNQFRLHATANSAALNKAELKLFMERVISEIQSLNKIAVSSYQDM